MKINKVSPQEHPYLQMVTSIAKPPKCLYYMGTLPTHRVPTVAIIGTRRPTPYGRQVTERFASELASKGVVIVSGLALGVDALAHQATLDVSGTTIAILANALPDIRPMTNRAIGERILAQRGAIVSESDGEKPLGKWSFLERNRIVAGIADAILITEASSRSGTLNTAARALEQGKDVFVVPGNITSPSSAGCNLLLKQGAIPVTEVNDILERLAPDLASAQTQLALGTTDAEVAILAQLSNGLRDGEEIQRVTGLEAGDMNMSLTMLEINGVIRSLGANQWTLR
ncbi:MAG: DNA-processing protein DprA [Candidatus Saccharimonas sp.]